MIMSFILYQQHIERFDYELNKQNHIEDCELVALHLHAQYHPFHISQKTHTY